MAISTLEIANHVAFEFRRFYFLTQVPILGHLTFCEKRNASLHIQVCASDESDPCSLEGVDEIVVALLELALIKDFLAAMLYSARHSPITVDYVDFHMLPAHHRCNVHPRRSIRNGSEEAVEDTAEVAGGRSKGFRPSFDFSMRDEVASVSRGDPFFD